jgi:hypothetical protein
MKRSSGYLASEPAARSLFLIIEIVSTPWLLLALLALAAVGILFAVLLHFTRRERPPTIFG